MNRNNILLDIIPESTPPRNLSVNNITDQSALVSWEAPETSYTLTGYAYQYKKPNEADWSDEITTTGTSATLGGLEGGTEYQFRVKGVFSDHEGIYTNINFTTVAITLPNLAVGVITNESATLTWEEPETPYTVTGYVYQYKKASDTNWSDEAFTTATTATLGGLVGGTEYQFRARALFSDHEGAWSTIGFTTVAITLPNFTVSNITDQSATITWEAPQTQYALTGYAYQYKRAADANWSAEATTTNTSVTLNGLEVFTEYQFRAKALFSDHENTYNYLGFTTAMPLPYECGFENGMGGFNMVDCNVNWLADIHFNTYTGRRTQAKHDGEVGFQFFRSGDQSPQYLISPRFAGNANILMSFYYRNVSSVHHETFQVGYSTTTADLDAFTWSDEITAADMQWTRHEIVGTNAKYFAIKYTSNEYKFHLDDFSFTAYSPYPQPADIVVSNINETSATLSWTAPQTTYTLTGYAYQYKTLSETEWSAETTVNDASLTLNGLSSNTTYDFRVKALYAGNNASNYVSSRFLTEGGMESLPHFQGFENGMGGWRVVDGKPNTGIYSNRPDYIYNGACSFTFDDVPMNSIPQYLISPRFDGNSSMIITFYYKNVSEDAVSYTADFKVGYSTTTKDLEAFTWGNTIRSSHQWQQYIDLFPEGTKYVAVQWIRGFWLYLDEFNMEIGPSCGDPITVDIDHPFTEDFEGLFFPPLCWDRNSYVMDGDTRCWKKETEGIHSGLASASNSYYGNLYLKTPELHLAENACEIQLSFWALFRNLGIYTKSSVVLIEGDHETEVWAADSYTAVGDGNWREIDIDLSAYRGHTFSLAFKHEGYPTHMWVIDDVEISVAATCEVPTDINLSFSNTDATVTWADEAEAWQLCLDDDDNYIDVNEPAYTFTELESCSTHTVKVRAKCGEGCFSLWSDPIRFYISTPITTFPWTEDFESYNANSLPYCWDNSASTSPTLSYNASSLWGVYNANGNMMIRMYEQGVQPGIVLINTPIIALPSEGEIELKFDYSHLSACGPFTVKISTDHGATFVDLASYSRLFSYCSINHPIEFLEAVIPLTDYAGQEVMIQFYAVSTWYRGAIFIDNIEIRVPPTCRNANGLRTENITTNSAELSWNVSADMESYTVRHRTAASLADPCFTEGFENGLDNWTLRDNQSGTGIYNSAFRFGGYSNFPSQYLISPLLTEIDEGKKLEFYYKNYSRDYVETFHIGFSSTDTETDSFTFGDEIIAYDQQWHLYSMPIPAGTKYICWKYTSRFRQYLYIDNIAVGDEISAGEWQFLPVTGSGTQVSATITGLTLETQYEAQVKSNCEEAEWSRIISFSTPSDVEIEGDVYTIYTATGWDFFCDALQDNDTYNHFRYKTVKLGDDISVSRMAGSTGHEFGGHFDGQGHTLNVNIVESETWAAPFSEIKGGTICNLKVTGSVAGRRHSAGLVVVARGENSSNVSTIENCRVSTAVSINNDNTGYMGGIVGHGTSCKLVIRGCVFDGSLTSTANSVGGLQGWSDGNTLTLENNLFAGTVSAVTFHPVALHNSGKTTNATVSNVYYTVEPTETNPAYIAATGCLVFNDPAVSPVGDATATYDVSSLAVYGNGILCGSTFYRHVEPILRHITGYGDDMTTDGGWYLVASPLAEPMTPTADNGFLTAEFDLYRFDQSEELEWRNYKANAFVLENSRGYLYASQANTTLVFDGMPYSGSGEVALVKAGGGQFEGWNLIGNPFGTAKSLGSKPFYRMNDLGTEIIAAETSTVEATEGVFVVANADGETVTFATPTRGNGIEERIVINLCSNDNVIDRAIVRFGEGEPLPKLQIRGNGDMLSIPQGGEDYAVIVIGRDGVHTVSTTDVPVNFKAAKNDEYTLSFHVDNVELDYLHLIDNLTGADIDLLQTNEYTFTAKTTDYTSRFKLVFSAASAGSAADNFAYVDAGGNIIITADAHGTSLQVIDVMGRVVVCRDASNASAISTTGIPAGVYVLRLIDGENVRTQKIVIE